MLFSIFEQGASFIRKQARHKRWLIVCVCLALVAASGTILALKLNGQAMTHKQKVLQCPYEVHVHKKECYDQNTQELICGYADYVVHTHNVDCYDDNGKLQCQLPEVEEHKHDETCYEDQKVLICTETESAGHQHTAECYQEERGELTCGLTEHQHGDECYDETGAVACGMEEHQHNDSCYAINSVLICGMEEGSGGHSHTDSCYETRKVLTCGKLENHTHDEKNCYDKDGNLTCKEIVLEEHVHNSDCFVTVELTPEEVAALNQPSPSPEIFFTEGETGSAAEASDVEENTADSELGSSLEEGSAMEGDTLVDFPLKKTAKLGTLTITAKYYEKAEIPEEAELEVRLISEEAETAECLKTADEWITPADKTWLYDIGFYQDGKEVQPKDTVYVTMQVAEDWLRAGTPVSVVQFVNDEPVLLETPALREMEDGSFATEFDVEIFSRFLLILGEAPQTTESGKETVETEKTEYELSDSFDYETDNFTMKIQVDGVATAETPVEVEEVETEDSAAEPVETVGSGLKAGDAPEEEPEAEPEKIQVTTEPEDEADETEKTEAVELGDNAVENAGEAEEENSAAEPSEDGKLTAEDVDFSVELLDRKDPLYQAFEAALDAKAQETAVKADKDDENSTVEAAGDEVSLLALSVMRFNFALDGVELDVSDCKITAEVTPKSAAFASVEIPEDASVELEPGLTLTAMQIADEDKAIAQVEELETMTVSQSELGTMLLSLDGGVMALAEEDATNIPYTVQYYGNLDVIASESAEAAATLKVIDTSKATGEKGLPSNGNLKLKEKALCVRKNGVVIREFQHTQLFRDHSYNYKTQPGLEYIKLLPSGDGDHFRLSEVWVLKDGKSAQDVAGEPNEDDWTVYNANAVFISNAEGADKDGKTRVVLKKDGSTVLRLVYDQMGGERNISAAFFDYDISSGPSTAKNVTTKANGINDQENYKGQSGTRFAFGNANAGTDFGKLTWNNNNLNMANKRSYELCTFGLVTGLNGDSPQFAGGVAAPALFGSASAIGKHVYASSSLNFDRHGDTYTLSSASVSNGTVSSSVGNLDKFTHPGIYDGVQHTTKIWTNNFWPMDSIVNTDPLFGKPNQIKYNSTSNHLPESDDGGDHNSYFGMQYAIEFTLDESYRGPLEYLFYGDDDMWAILDGETVVIDIGGVHRSVGEYADLWDYLAEKDANGNITKVKEGTHTLHVFYTERGASGSTCFMQFTLPSVMSIAPVAAYGDFEISKAVDGPETDEPFAFELTLDCNTSYNYYIFDKNGTSNVSGKIDGGSPLSFELKDGERLSIIGVHENTPYTLKEQVYEGYEPTVTVNGKEQTLNEDGELTGTINGQSTVSVAYTNHTIRVLPETGGSDIKPIYAIGGAVILAAVLLYGGVLWRRRKRKSVSES